MLAHKLTVTVPESGHIEIDLPSDFRGGEAEVIVLVPHPSSARPRPGSREALLAADPVIEAWRAGNPDKLRTADEIDAQRGAVHEAIAAHPAECAGTTADLDPLPLPAVPLEDDLDVAPLDLSELTPEQQAEIQESLASLAVGRARTVAHEEVLRALDEMHHWVD